MTHQPSEGDLGFWIADFGLEMRMDALCPFEIDPIPHGPARKSDIIAVGTGAMKQITTIVAAPSASGAITLPPARVARDRPGKWGLVMSARPGVGLDDEKTLTEKSKFSEANSDFAEANSDFAEANSDLAEANSDLAEANSDLLEANSDLAEARFSLAEANSDLAEANSDLAEANLLPVEEKSFIAEANFRVAEAKLRFSKARILLAAANLSLVEALTVLGEAKSNLSEAKFVLATAGVSFEAETGAVCGEMSFDTAATRVFSAHPPIHVSLSFISACGGRL